MNINESAPDLGALDTGRTTPYDEPRPEYVAMAQASFARIVSAAEEIAWDHPLGSGEGEIDVHEEVGFLVASLWHRLAEADGITSEGERIALERVVAGDPTYAAVVAKYAGIGPTGPRESALMRAAKERPVARRHISVELETFGYALASVDRTFDHAELDALHLFLEEIGS